MKKITIWPLRIGIAAFSAVFVTVILLAAALQGVAVWLNTDAGAQRAQALIQGALSEAGYTARIGGFRLSGLSRIGAETFSLEQDGKILLQGEDLGVSLNILPLTVKTASIFIGAKSLSLENLPAAAGRKTPQAQGTQGPFPAVLPDLYFNRLAVRLDIGRLSASSAIVKGGFTARLKAKHDIGLENGVLKASGAVTIGNIEHSGAKYVPEVIAYDTVLDLKTGAARIEKLDAGNALYDFSARGLYDIPQSEVQAEAALSVENPAQDIYEGFSQPLAVAARLQGTLENLAGSVKIDSAVKESALSLDIPVFLHGKTLELGDLSGVIGETPLSGKLSVSLDSGLLEGTIRAAAIDPAVIRNFAGPLPVSMKGTGAVVFAVRQPGVQSLDASARLSDIVYADIKAATADISFSTPDMRDVKNFHIDAHIGNLAYATARVEAIDAAVSSKGPGFNLILKGNGADRNPFTVSGDMDMEWPGPVRMAGTVNRLDIGLSGGKISMSGGFAPENLNLKALFLDIDLAKIPVHPVDAFPARLKKGEAVLNGTFKAPIIRSQFHWEAMQRPAAGAAITTKASYEAEKIEAALSASGRGIGNLKGTLSLPAAFTLDPFAFSLPEQAPLSGAIKGDVALADFAEAFLAGTGLQLKGALALDGRLEGTPRAPAIGGSVSLAGGYFHDASSGVELNAVNGKIKFDRSTLTLESLTGKDREDGTLEARGVIGFADPANPDVDMRVKMDSMSLVQSDLVHAKLDADLALRRDADAFLLSGTVTPEDALIELPDRFGKEIPRLNIVDADGGDSGNFVEKLRLDIAFNAERRIFVRGWGLDAELGGNLAVKGTAKEPDAQGALSSIRGRYEEFGRKFDIARVILRFHGAVPPSPYLDILAQTKSGDITAQIAITGTAAKPAPALTSVPSLPQDEILSRILFGQPSSKITPFQAVQLAQSIRRFSGQGGGPDIDPLGAIRSVTGLDDITVSGVGTENATVGAGKYIGDKVYVEIEQGTAESSGAASVTVELTPHISVESKAGRSGSGGGAVFWEWNY